MARKLEPASSLPPSFSTRTNTATGYSTRPSYNQQPSRTHGSSQPQTPPHTFQAPSTRNFRNVRQISNEEYLKHRAAGTCFKCGLKYGPTHRCPPKTLNVLVGTEEDDVNDEFPKQEDSLLEEFRSEDDSATFQHLQLSELTSNGLDGPQTMKLFGKVGETRLLLMIDSGARHCFVAEQVAHKLNWTIEPTTRFSVVLGHGTRVRSGGICKNIPLMLDSELFHISCYVFPLSSVDLILGVSWLATLGEVKANRKNLTMEFSIGERSKCLRGDPTLTRKACNSRELQLLASEDECWFLWSMDGKGV